MKPNTNTEAFLRELKDILHMQKVVMMEHNGRPDCKNCSLAETIEEVLEKYEASLNTEGGE